jgi:hypothetical protein
MDMHSPHEPSQAKAHTLRGIGCSFRAINQFRREIGDEDGENRQFNRIKPFFGVNQNGEVDRSRQLHEHEVEENQLLTWYCLCSISLEWYARTARE